MKASNKAVSTALKITKSQKFKTKHPLLKAEYHILRPEVKNIRRLHSNDWQGLQMNIWDHQTVRHRMKNIFEDNIYHSSWDCFYHMYSHRWNLQQIFGLFWVSAFAGAIAFYLNHKINIIEKYWGDEYGQDYPFRRRLWLLIKVSEYRITHLHFQKFKLKYSRTEQVIDPLNKSSLAAESFQVYQQKRMIREQKYDDGRDPSFDFMSIGEDDIEQFDDFV